jgi:Family of unknown function (DUF6599)
MIVARLAALILALGSVAPGVQIADCLLVGGWNQDGEARTFGPDNLFEYVDGEANGYLIYGFTRLQNVTCKSGKSGAESITIDVSEMADADAAYGIFSARQDARQPIARIGMGGQIQPQHAAFCKGKYYVELTANSGNDNTAALQAFVNNLEKRLTGRTDPPAAVAWFPNTKLVSVQLIPESVLGLSLLKRGYVAQYESGKAFVVEEQSAESAAAVIDKLRKKIAEAASTTVADEAFLAKDRYLGELCFFRKGRYLGGVANLSSAQEAMQLASTLAAGIP